MRISCSQEQ